MAEKHTSRKQMVFEITHYKNSVFFISQNVRVALTIVNVEYSEFMNLLKNQNVLRTFTRSTFTHTQNIAIIAFHSVVKVWCTFLQNAPKCSPDNEIATCRVFTTVNTLLRRWFCKHFLYLPKIKQVTSDE